MFSRLGSAMRPLRRAAALRGAVGQQVAVAAGADMRAAHDKFPDPLGIGDRRHHRRLPALRVADPVRLRDAERVEQCDRGPRLDRVHPLAVDDRAGLRKIRQIHQDAAEMLRQRAHGLVKRDPGGGAGAVGVEEQHRLACAQIVVVHVDAPWHAAHRDGLAGAFFGQPVRPNKRHRFLSSAFKICTIRRIRRGRGSCRRRKVHGDP